MLGMNDITDERESVFSYFFDIKGISKGTEVGEGVRLALKNLLK